MIWRERMICPRCNGSGEGMTDGSRCTLCRGGGEADTGDDEDHDAREAAREDAWEADRDLMRED